MQLKAVYRIRGVKEVIKGKGKGTTVAEPGDIFVPCDEATGNSLYADGNAVKPSESHVHVSKLLSGPAVKMADDLSDEDGIDLSAVPAKLVPPAEKPLTKSQKAAAAKTTKVAPTSGASLDDLGLGDDDGEEDKVE